MRRSTVIPSALLFLSLLPASVWADKPRSDAAGAALTDCQSAALPQDRYLTLSATIRSTDTADELWIRFTLLERLPGQSWRDVTPNDLQDWRKRSGVSEFKSTQTVREIDTPALYRGLVQFRWYRDGEPVGTDSRKTQTCSQKMRLADLVAEDIEVGSGSTPATYLYTLTVANSESRVARNFNVSLAVGDKVIGQKTSATLQPKAKLKLTVEAPACAAGEQISGSVDQGNRVEELSETNNTLQEPCPTA